MKRRSWVVCIALLALAICVSMWLQGSRREIGRTPNGDGTTTVATGQARLWGLLGVEITFAVLDKDGHTVFSTGVRDVCRSWSEARSKHSTPSPIRVSPGAQPPNDRDAR
jgi:hypothetical protein